MYNRILGYIFIYIYNTLHTTTTCLPATKSETCGLFLHSSYHNHQGGWHIPRSASVVQQFVFVAQQFAFAEERFYACNCGGHYAMLTADHCTWKLKKIM